MKSLHTSAGIIALILLQACSSQPTQSKTSQTTDTAVVDAPLFIKTSLKTGTVQSGINDSLNTRQQLPVPELQIIRELYQSGCLIEELEINRRKQHIRISCADDKSFRSSI